MERNSSRAIPMSPLEDVFTEEVEDNDLSFWEFVYNCDGEYSDDCLSVASLPDDPFAFDWSSYPSFLPAAAEQNLSDLLIALPNLDFLCEIDRDDVEIDRENVLHKVSGISGDDRRKHDEEVVDGEDDDGSCDLDDELVPKYVRAKLARERMRKLGKRSFSKMNHSKRSPFSHVKPGCVYGKHGLGMKFR